MTRSRGGAREGCPSTSACSPTGVPEVLGAGSPLAGSDREKVKGSFRAPTPAPRPGSLLRHDIDVDLGRFPTAPAHRSDPDSLGVRPLAIEDPHSATTEALKLLYFLDRRGRASRIPVAPVSGKTRGTNRGFRSRAPLDLVRSPTLGREGDGFNTPLSPGPGRGQVAIGARPLGPQVSRGAGVRRRRKVGSGASRRSP